MIRRLAPPPDGWNGRLPPPPAGALAVNVADGRLAAYWADGDQRALTDQQWATHVATASYAPPVEETNRAQLEQALRQAIVANKNFLADPLPTAAIVTGQTKALTRQMNQVIRLVLGALDAID